MPRDLKLATVPGTNDHDLLIENFDLQLTELDLEEIRQSLQVRLKYFFSEWFLDNTEGVKYYEHIFVKNPDIDVVGAVLKTRILTTRGVKELLQYSQDYDNALRSISISFKVDTDLGELTDVVIVGV